MPTITIDNTAPDAQGLVVQVFDEGTITPESSNPLSAGASLVVDIPDAARTVMIRMPGATAPSPTEA